MSERKKSKKKTKKKEMKQPKKIKGSYCERTLMPESAFEPNSFRWKKSRNAWILVGRLKGERTTTGHKLLVPTRFGKCLLGTKVEK